MMTLHPPRMPIVVAALLLTAAAAMGQPGEASSATKRVFYTSVDASVVNVDLYVTDENGERVTRLGADDFEVFEDDRPVAITNFTAVEGGRLLGPVPEEPNLVAAPDLERHQPAVLPEDQRLSLIVFFDNLFLEPFHRNRVAGPVRSFLRRELGPNDQVMLVTAERGLHVRVPFTTDAQQVVEELFEIETLSALGAQAKTERKEAIRRVMDSDDAFEAQSWADSYAAALHNDLVVTLGLLEDLVESLAGLPGRKALLHVSDGLPMTAGEDLFFLVDQKFGASSFGGLSATRYRVRRQIDELAAKASANRVTFYTLEAAGLRSHTSLSAEFGALGTSVIEADFLNDASRQSTLQVMAEKTGGIALFNSNNVALALDQLATDMRSFYSLGYQPAHHGDGRFHTIEVRPKNRRYTVRHRPGYRDKTVEVRVAEGTMATLLFGEGENPLGVELELGTPSFQGQSRYLVPVTIRIPIGKVTLLPRGGLHAGEVLASVAAIDAEGGTSPMDQTPLPIEVPAADLERARSQLFVYSVELLMKPGRQAVAVGVRDTISGETSFVRSSIDVRG